MSVFIEANRRGIHDAARASRHPNNAAFEKMPAALERDEPMPWER